MDDKARNNWSLEIPGTDGVYCPNCGRNSYITVVEPASTPVYQCENCHSGFSMEGDALARADGIPADERPRQELVNAEGGTTETEDAAASRATDPDLTQDGAQWAATTENPSAEVGAKPQSRKGRRTPGPRNKFDPYWDTDIVPMLEKDQDGGFTAAGILNFLIDWHPGALNVNKSINTFKNLEDVLHKMMKRWRADHNRLVRKRKRRGTQGSTCNGSKTDKHKTGSSTGRACKRSKTHQRWCGPRQRGPGQEAEVDFTPVNELGITIQEYPEPPLLFVYRLTHSRLTYAETFSGETVAALSEGVQNALVETGGVPQRLHKDRHVSSIWYDNPIPPFDLVLKHYGLKLTLSNQGCPWENGSVERSNGLIKDNLEQLLLERGSRDFASLAAFQDLVRRAVNWMNRRVGVQMKLAEERELLRPLPTDRAPTYKVVKRRVKLGWVNLYGRFYGVPYGVGKTVVARMYGHRIEVYRQDPDDPLGGNSKPVKTWPRSQPPGSAQIERHSVLRSLLLAEPTEFSRLPEGVREAMFPATTFKQTFQRLKTWCGQKAFLKKRGVGLAPDSKKIGNARRIRVFSYPGPGCGCSPGSGSGPGSTAIAGKWQAFLRRGREAGDAVIPGRRARIRFAAAALRLPRGGTKLAPRRCHSSMGRRTISLARGWCRAIVAGAAAGAVYRQNACIDRHLPGVDNAQLVKSAPSPTFGNRRMSQHLRRR